MQSVIDIRDLTKTYAGGFEALKNVSLAINKGEIFALLGPNGAGKTTLINIVCGIVNATGGKVLVALSANFDWLAPRSGLCRRSCLPRPLKQYGTTAGSVVACSARAPILSTLKGC
jgi:ABC-type branched-subunit amino acid transport system ATPase component